MREIKRIAVGLIERDAEQPRKHFDEADLQALGQNLKAVGQQYPVIVYPDGDRWRLADGERRWRAAQLVGITELDALIVPEKPTPLALHMVQISLEAHKKGLSPMELCNFLHQIRTERSWSVTELATNVQMKQPVVSKLLGYLRLDPQIQALLHAGKLDTERAFIISQEPDRAKQRAMLEDAGKLTRDQLRQRVKAKGAAEAKAQAAKFVMPGVVVGIEANGLTLPMAIEVFLETAKLLKKYLGQRLDIVTVQRVMRDQARKP
jgi:ParB/RepB/Spo0J family partition protein